MMRDSSARFRRRLGAADIEPAIELNGIEVDDFSARSFSQAKSEMRFSDAGRAGDHHGRVRSHARSLAASAGHVGALIFPRQNVAQMRSAVDRTGRNRSLADCAAIPGDLRCSFFQQAQDDSGDDQKNADDERLLQHWRGEVGGEVGLGVRLVQNVEGNHCQDDPETKAQDGGRHRGDSTVSASLWGVNFTPNKNVIGVNFDVDRPVAIRPKNLNAALTQRIEDLLMRVSEQIAATAGDYRYPRQHRLEKSRR